MLNQSMYSQNGSHSALQQPYLADDAVLAVDCGALYSSLA